MVMCRVIGFGEVGSLLKFPFVVESFSLLRLTVVAWQAEIVTKQQHRPGFRPISQPNQVMR